MRWSSTISAHKVSRELWPVKASTLALQCISVVTLENVSFKIDDWVLSQNYSFEDTASGPLIRCVCEIVQVHTLSRLLV